MSGCAAPQAYLELSVVGLEEAAHRVLAVEHDPPQRGRVPAQRKTGNEHLGAPFVHGMRFFASREKATFAKLLLLSAISVSELKFSLQQSGFQFSTRRSGALT